MSAVAEGVTFFNVVAGLATPIAHFAIVFAPGVHGTVANGGLSLSSSFALEVGGLVHVAINAMAYMGNSISGGQAFRTLVYC